jgi:hypothetical protein
LPPLPFSPIRNPQSSRPSAFDPIMTFGASMPVQVICPSLTCRKILAVPEEVRGKLVKCQHCQTAFRVPEGTPRKPEHAGAKPATR